MFLFIYLFINSFVNNMTVNLAYKLATTTLVVSQQCAYPPLNMQFSSTSKLIVLNNFGRSCYTSTQSLSLLSLID